MPKETGDIMKRAGIIGLGYYVPEKVLTNKDLEQMVETSDEWIIKRTGIKQRRISAKNEYSAEMGTKAAQKAIENAKINPEDIDLVICATTTPDYFTPSNACIIQKNINAVNAAAIDINSACTGFVSACITAQQFIENGYYKTVLVVAAEALSEITDFNDRKTCILFGDGAGAAVLAACDKGGIIQSHMGAKGNLGHNITALAVRKDADEDAKRLSHDGRYLWMDGSEVLKFAVRAMTNATNKLMADAGLTVDDIDCLVPHQANVRIIDGAVKRLGIDPKKVFVNIESYGNMAAASVPVALCEAMERGKIKKGDKVVIVSFGGGLTWGAVLIEM